jgi:hypothetical protein
MKHYLLQSSVVSLLLPLLGSGSVRAQTTPAASNQPLVITVLATEPNASVSGAVPGSFEISHTGETNDALTVLYSLGGTARNGAGLPSPTRLRDHSSWLDLGGCDRRARCFPP